MVWTDNQLIRSNLEECRLKPPQRALFLMSVHLSKAAGLTLDHHLFVSTRSNSARMGKDRFSWKNRITNLPMHACTSPSALCLPFFTYNRCKVSPGLTWWEGDGFQELYFPQARQRGADLPLKQTEQLAT